MFKPLLSSFLVLALTFESTSAVPPPSPDLRPRIIASLPLRILAEAFQLQPVWWSSFVADHVSRGFGKAFSIHRDAWQRLKTSSGGFSERLINLRAGNLLRRANKAPMNHRTKPISVSQPYYRWSSTTPGAPVPESAVRQAWLNRTNFLERWKGALEIAALAIKTLLLLGGVALIIFTATITWHITPPIVIDPIEVPDTLGVRSTVFQQKILDEVQRIEQAAQSGLAIKKTSEWEVSVQVPVPKKVDFDLPGTGLSYRRAVELLQKARNNEPSHIGGEVTYDSKDLAIPFDKHKFSLTVRGNTDKGSWTRKPFFIEAKDIEALVHQVSKEILHQSDPHTLAAYLYYTENDANGALKLIGEASDPKDLKWAYVLHGNIVKDPAVDRPKDDDILKDRIQSAITLYKKSLDIDPNNADAHNSWGNALLEQANLEYNVFADNQPEALRIRQQKRHWAIVHFKMAICIDRTNVAAYNNWGDTLHVEEEFKEAISKYRKAIDLDPNSSKSYHNWGRELQYMNDFDGAIVKYRKALELDPKSVQTYHNWFTAVRMQGLRRSGGKRYDYHEAISVVSKGLAIMPDEEHLLFLKNVIELDEQDEKEGF